MHTRTLAAVSAIVTGAALLTSTAATAAPTTAQAASQQITVNLAQDTGPVFHGASGALYGLSETACPAPT